MTTRLVRDATELDALPVETLARASGRHVHGAFTQCWVRPIPNYITGAPAPRLWQVLVHGASDSWTTAADMTYPVEVLYTEEES